MKSEPWNEIAITDIEGFKIGNAEYPDGGTGCTVILADPAACTGLDVRGGAPASREAALLNPLAANDAVNAVVLSGGSAFGLDSASGVVRYLEERGIGFPTALGVVPIVCASCLFDLGVKTPSIRPDSALGYQACENAGNFRQGNYGAGTGASCGKGLGLKHAMKSGLGAYALAVGALKVGAIVAANPLGNIYDPDTGEALAGIRAEDDSIVDSEAVIARKDVVNTFRGNTTIGVILTNAKFNKTQLCKIASMAHDGYARAIRPVHTMDDGDSIYAMSGGDVKADINVAGVLAAKVMARAIANAARYAEDAYGLKAYHR
ncbi:MAG: P1 family peptidase [Solobacterium sp.]|nr:P1 family peptidase [Solobacterium sp.]